MLNIILGLISFLTGVAVTFQSACNGGLRTATKNPLFASLASFATGLLLLFLLLPIASWLGIYPWPTMASIASTKWWMWTGGLIGTALVLGSILIPGKIGFGSYFSMLVAGQLVGSVVADTLGFLGSQPHPFSFLRLVGILCLIVGAVLVQRNKSNQREKLPKGESVDTP